MTLTKASVLSALSLCAALLMGCAQDAPEPVDLALTHVTVIDAVNPVRRNQTVLIDDGRIIDIVDSDTAPEIPATEQLDASGQYLIPGLWDFHVHFTFDKRFTDAMAGLFLYHGITNVRDTGITHIGNTVVEEEPRHGIGKSFVEGEVNVKVPKPGNEVLPAGVELLCGRNFRSGVAVDNIDDAPVVDEHGLIAANRVHRVDHGDVRQGEINRLGRVLCAAHQECCAEREGRED